MKKVRILKAPNSVKLENYINEFLKNQASNTELIDIKTFGRFDQDWFVLIVYEEFQ